MQGMESTDIELKPGLRIGIESDGLALHLTVFAYENEPFGPIELSQAQAIQVGRELCTTGHSDTIPISFLTGDAEAFGKRLIEIASDPA